MLVDRRERSQIQKFGSFPLCENCSRCSRPCGVVVAGYSVQYVVEQHDAQKTHGAVQDGTRYTGRVSVFFDPVRRSLACAGSRLDRHRHPSSTAPVVPEGFLTEKVHAVIATEIAITLTKAGNFAIWRRRRRSSAAQTVVP